MPVIETMQAVSLALSSVKTLSEVASTVKNAEVRQELNSKIADLQGALIAARGEMLELQDKYEQVLRENKRLKEATAPREKPEVVWGCYRFEGDDNLYCTVCYDTQGKKMLTTRLSPKWRQCPYCMATFGT